MAYRIVIRSSLALRRPSPPLAIAWSFPAATLSRCIRRRHALATKVAALPRRARSLRPLARVRWPRRAAAARVWAAALLCRLVGGRVFLALIVQAHGVAVECSFCCTSIQSDKQEGLMFRGGSCLMSCVSPRQWIFNPVCLWAALLWLKRAGTSVEDRTAPGFGAGR